MRRVTLLLAIFHFAFYASAQHDSHFIENKGQVIDQNGLVRQDILYIADNQHFKLYLKKNSFSYVLYSTVTIDLKASQLKEDLHSTKKLTVQSHRVDIDLIGANDNPSISAEGKSTTYYNYYTSGTPHVGITNVHSFDKITYKNIYNNIDLIFYASPTQLKYDFIINPGGNIDDIQLAYQGADALSIENGNVKIETSQGDVKEHMPVVYENRLGGNKTVEANFKLDNNVVRFNVDDYNANNTLVIDPQLIWATYFGGSNVDEACDVVSDQSGNAVVVGYTASTANIATSGAYQNTYGGGNYDAYIFKMNSNGTAMLWATYYGGSDFDQANGIVVDAQGDFFIAGESVSTSVPKR